MRPIDVFLWVVVPYVCLAVFVLGHVWRYRYDKFGWTTRSSQLYERRLLRWVGPVFSATTRMDKKMYLFLSAVILLGLWNTVASNIFGHYDYRDGVSVWFR